MSRKLSGDDVALIAAAGGLVAAGFLPWSRPENTFDDTWSAGYGDPYGSLVVLAALASLVMVGEVLLTASRGGSVLAPDVRGRVHVVLGCGALLAVGFKFVAILNTLVAAGTWIGLVTAAVLAYEGYLHMWAARAQAHAAQDVPALRDVGAPPAPARDTGTDERS